MRIFSEFLFCRRCAIIFLPVLIFSVTVFVFRILDSSKVSHTEQESTDDFSELSVDEPELDSSYEVLVTVSKFPNLVNILDLDNTFIVDLKYATADNFTGIVLYDDIDAAYLHPEVAQMLVEAHRYLKELHPDSGFRFIVYDAARPLSVQQLMWERVKDTPYHRYVAHPDRRSLHNFAAAVDLTIANRSGVPLDMGTIFDHFGRAAGINNEEELVRQGILTRQHIQNRELLRKVMRHAGFRTISGEWWHFNACSLQEAMQRYELIE